MTIYTRVELQNALLSLDKNYANHPEMVIAKNLIEEKLRENETHTGVSLEDGFHAFIDTDAIGGFRSRPFTDETFYCRQVPLVKVAK